MTMRILILTMISLLSLSSFSAGRREIYLPHFEQLKQRRVANKKAKKLYQHEQVCASLSMWQFNSKLSHQMIFGILLMSLGCRAHHEYQKSRNAVVSSCRRH